MILFVNPPSRAGVYQGLGDSLAAIEPPLWIRLLSSYCEKKGIETAILDADAEGYDAETAIQKAVDANPTLAVVVAHGQQPSASTQVMPAVIYFCQRFKAEREDVPVLVVGGHPAALPGRTLEETGADFVCAGEGPVTIVALMECLKSGMMFSSKSDAFKDVSGLCYRVGRLIIKSTPAENIWNLTEEMPGGMWDKLPMHKYRAHLWHCLQEQSRQPYASIYSSLGCPYACSFCNIQNPFREGDKLKYDGKANSYRMWSPAHVADEIQLLVEKHGVTNIKISDEMFVLNRAHVLGICGEIIGRGLGDKLNMWAYARVDTIKDDGLLEKIRAAGIKWIALGIESASDFVRDGVDKADYGPADIYRACERLRTHGINLIANFIVGLPDDTTETMRDTMRMAYEIMPDFLNLYGCQIYPGSPLWDEAQREGRELSGDWRTYAHHGYECVPASTRTLSSAEVLRFRDQALTEFFMSPEYQSHVLTKFGPKAAVEIAEMVRVPLKRALLED